jgi:hypothetical protein
MFHGWGRRNPGMMVVLQQQPFIGPLLTVADMLGSEPSAAQRDADWRERTAGRRPGEISVEELADSPLMSLALGTVVPFGRAGQAPHLARARNLGFSEPGYVAGRSYSDDLAEAMADIPYDQLLRGHVVAATPEQAMRIAGINPGDPGVGVQVMRVLARPGRVEPVMAPRGISDVELQARVFDAWDRGAGSVRVLGDGWQRLLVADQHHIRAGARRLRPIGRPQSAPPPEPQSARRRRSWRSRHDAAAQSRVAGGVSRTTFAALATAAAMSDASPDAWMLSRGAPGHRRGYTTGSGSGGRQISTL